MTNLADLNWVQVDQARRRALLVPLGSLEQHGPHLPLDTDTRIALAVAGGLAARHPGTAVAPAIALGASGEHAGFPGTLSIGQEALESVLVELARSADAFAGVVFVSGHGGNAVPLSRAVHRLQGEGRRVLSWSPGPGTEDRGPAGEPPTRLDAHAGRTETSVLMALAPGAVRVSQAQAGGPVRPLPELMPVLLRRGVAAVSPNGVLGDPSGATVENGKRVLEAWTADLVAALEGWP